MIRLVFRKKEFGNQKESKHPEIGYADDIYKENHWVIETNGKDKKKNMRRWSDKIPEDNHGGTHDSRFLGSPELLLCGNWSP